MLGKIIRVGGVFKASGLPKLEDHDTSDLMNAILSNDAVAAFYDFTDESTIEFNGDKVIKVEDKKSGQQLKQVDLALAPKYNRSIFNGAGGLYFDGESSMSADVFYTGASDGAVSIFAFPAALPAKYAFFIGDHSSGGYSIYHDMVDFVAFNGVSRNVDGAILKHNHIVNSWSSKNILMTVNGKSRAPGSSPFPASIGANIGRWSNTRDPHYFKGYLGHVILINKDIINDEYLNQLISEYCKRRYKHYI